MIVLDTNVLSELMRPAPSRQVVRWLEREPPSSVFTTSITQAEILHGILLLPAGRRRDGLEAAAQAMFAEELAGRILGFTSEAAPFYARIAADRRHAGRPISHFDAQIGAIARLHDAVLATRNTADFEGCGLRLIDPWAP